MIVTGHTTSEHVNFKRKLCARNIFPADMFQVNTTTGALPPRRCSGAALDMVPSKLMGCSKRKVAVAILFFSILKLNGVVSASPTAGFLPTRFLVLYRKEGKKCSYLSRNPAATSCFEKKTWSRINAL